MENTILNINILFKHQRPALKMVFPSTNGAQDNILKAGVAVHQRVDRGCFFFLNSVTVHQWRRSG